SSYSYDKDIEKEARYVTAEESKHPFDLSNGPILRVGGIILSSTSKEEEEDDSGGKQSNDLILLFNIHHIASDGWSNGIIMKEMEIFYEYFSKRSKEKEE